MSHGEPGRTWTIRGILVLPVALVCWACTDPTGAIEDPGEDDRVVNDPVEHANGMYFPESCNEPRDSIALLGRLDLPERLTDVWAYYDPGADREYALAGFQPSTSTDGGLYVIDVTDPADPLLVATLEDARANDVVVWRSHAYTVTGHAGPGEVGMIYDLADPTNPVAVGTFPSGHNLFVSDRGYLYKAQPGVAAYDLIPDPTAPELIWDDGRGGGHDVAVIDDLLLDFHGFDGTILYDNDNPLAPARPRVFENDSVRFHHSGWMSGDREHLYINDELPSNLDQNPDITVWHVPSREMVGTFRDTLSTVHNSYELCDRLIVSYYTKGLVLFDVTDPGRLTLLDEYDTDPDQEGPGLFLGAWGVYPYTRSGNVLVSDVDKGLYVFRLDG